MTCGRDSGITIELPRHGVEVRPKETDLRMKQRHYARGEFVMTEAAGQLVAETHNELTLAFLKIDGEVAHRMVLIGDAVSFNESLEETTVASVSLQDGRKVLATESVEKSFKDVDAEEVMDYLFDKRRDPENVITGYNFINPGDGEITATTSWFFESDGGILDQEPGQVNLDLDPFGLGTQIVDHLGFLDEESLGAYTFDFEGETVLEAMQQVMDDFELNWWVDNDGVIQIGPEGAKGQAVAKASGDNKIALSRYTVTQDTKTTNAVQVNVPVVNINDAQAYSSVNVNATQAIAESRAPGIDGSLFIISPDRSFSSLSHLERVASRRLYREVMDDTSGSMVINGLASSDIEALRNLDVGDFFGVEAGVEADCNQNVITGLFMVTSVHHKAGPRKGWEITIEVGRVPNPANLQTNSVLYDALEDKEYDSFAAYQGSGGDNLDVGSP